MIITIEWRKMFLIYHIGLQWVQSFCFQAWFPFFSNGFDNEAGRLIRTFGFGSVDTRHIEQFLERDCQVSGGQHLFSHRDTLHLLVDEPDQMF